jgi:hypothetical protein
MVFAVLENGNACQHGFPMEAPFAFCAFMPPASMAYPPRVPSLEKVPPDVFAHPKTVQRHARQKSWPPF